MLAPLDLTITLGVNHNVRFTTTSQDIIHNVSFLTTSQGVIH